MNSWKVILATVVIFVAGIVTGALVIRNLQSPTARPDSVPKAPATARAPVFHDNRPVIPQVFLMRANFVQKLDHELKLNEVQRAHVERIVREGQERIRQICQDMQPQIHATLVETRDRIAAELTPDQQTVYEELLRCKTAPKKESESETSKSEASK